MGTLRESLQAEVRALTSTVKQEHEVMKVEAVIPSAKKFNVAKSDSVINMTSYIYIILCV